MQTQKTTPLTLRSRIALPPRAVTRVHLQSAAATLQRMQPATVVIRDYGERDALQARVLQLEAKLHAANNAAAARAHREERVKAKTIRVVDRRHEWAAKMGLQCTAPLVAMTSTHVITADVWQQPKHED